MKLKNCKVGQKVVLKKNITKDDLSDGGKLGYNAWHSDTRSVCDELLAGGVVEVVGTSSDCVDLKHNDCNVFLLPKFVKLVETTNTQVGDTQETKKDLVVGDKVVLKPDTILDDLVWTDDCGNKHSYKSYCRTEHPELFEFSDKMLCGGIATIIGMDGNDYKLETDVGCYNTVSWWLDKNLVSLYTPQDEKQNDGLPVDEVSGKVGEIINEIKPFMLVEVLDNSLCNNLCTIGDRLVVRKVVFGGLVECFCSDSVAKERGTSVVAINKKQLKIINSNTGE